jgi:hypothetical protein
MMDSMNNATDGPPDNDNAPHTVIDGGKILQEPASVRQSSSQNPIASQDPTSYERGKLSSCLSRALGLSQSQRPQTRGELRETILVSNTDLYCRRAKCTRSDRCLWSRVFQSEKAGRDRWYSIH